MNVYDQAHSLAQAIKASAEFKEYEKMQLEIDSKPELSNMLKDFQQKSIEIQTKQMTGEEVGNDVLEGVQKLYQIIMQDPLAASYMQASMRFSIMIKDVYDIIGEASIVGEK